MQLPFSAEQFFGVFEQYNTDLPFAWAGSTALAVLSVALTFTRFSRLPFVILGLLWSWSALVYHIIYFSPINPAAFLFAGLFGLQALLLFFAAATGTRIDAAEVTGVRKWAGASMIGFALVIYPLIGYGLGSEFPRNPTFGLPCPLTIFTFGLLLGSGGKVSILLLFIPLVWSVIGSTAAVFFGVWQDLSLPLAAAAAVIIAVRDRYMDQAETSSPRAQSDRE